MKFLVIDVETGGLNSFRHSLLEFAAVLWEPGIEVRPILSYYVNENYEGGGLISVTKEALAVNGIKLKDVNEQGIGPDDLCGKFFGVQSEHFPDERIRLAGHNLAFDIGFIKRAFRLADTSIEYGDVFGHRGLDTASLLMWRMLSKDIPETSPSSDLLFELTGIIIPEEQRHRAMGDAIGTARALEVLYQRGQGLAPIYPPDSMLRWFDFNHLPEDLKGVSSHFAEVANEMCNSLPPGRERSAMLRKLLEAKDCAVRARIEARK